MSLRCKLGRHDWKQDEWAAILRCSRCRKSQPGLIMHGPQYRKWMFDSFDEWARKERRKCD